MRCLVISRPGAVPPPPQAMPGLFEGFKSWRERWRSKMENFEFFADGSGGWGLLNVADEVELSQVMMEYPFGPFSTMHVHLTVDGDTAMAQMAETMRQMTAAMGG